MPVTQLDSRIALIVIDLQKGIASIPCAHPMADVVKNAGNLIGTFRNQNLPVVLVNAIGVAPGRTEQSHRGGAFPDDWTHLLPELNRQPEDHCISKQTWGAFTNTDLKDYLKSSQVTQVVICGVATSLGVESTARQAHELGFNVTLAVDAMTDISAEAHLNSLERIFPRLGEIGTTKEVTDLLERGA